MTQTFSRTAAIRNALFAKALAAHRKLAKGAASFRRAKV
jgi:hypothetical protein